MLNSVKKYLRYSKQKYKIQFFLKTKKYSKYFFSIALSLLRYNMLTLNAIVSRQHTYLFFFHKQTASTNDYIILFNYKQINAVMYVPLYLPSTSKSF